LKRIAVSASMRDSRARLTLLPSLRALHAGHVDHVRLRFEFTPELELKVDVASFVSRRRRVRDVGDCHALTCAKQIQIPFDTRGERREVHPGNCIA